MPELTLQAVQSAAGYARSWLSFRQRYLRVPGIQVAMLYGDDIVLSEAFGDADVEQHDALTTEHRFRVASHSKMFTATAILQLAQHGRLRLDDAVGQWVSYLADDATGIGAVTTRELLSHSGGVIRDGIEADHWQLLTRFPDSDGLRALASSGARVLPRNDRFKYSNVGYSLLGQIVEAVSGSTYAEYVAANILEPLGMAHTTPEYDEAAGPHAVGYTSLAYGDKRVPIDHIRTGAMASATGFSSTAEDLCRFAAAHFSGDDRLLDEDAQRTMRHSWWEVGDPAKRHYGLGLGVTQCGERRLVGHSGGFPGFITHTLFDPDDRLAVSVLTNAIDGPADSLAMGLVKLVDAAAGSDGRAEPVERFACRLADMWSVRDVAVLGGRLLFVDPTATDPTDATFELQPEGETTLRITEGSGYGAVGETLEFTFASDGSVEFVRGAGGAAWWPIEHFHLGDRVTLPDGGSPIPMASSRTRSS